MGYDNFDESHVLESLRSNNSSRRHKNVIRHISNNCSDLPAKRPSSSAGRACLGGALCAGLVQAGAQVIVADLTEDGCKARVAALEKLGGKADYCLVDVTSRESIENLLAKAIEKAGRVDILVNCAGVNAGTSFLDATDADWDRILTINLEACSRPARSSAGTWSSRAAARSSTSAASPRTCRCRGCSPTRPRRPAC